MKTKTTYEFVGGNSIPGKIIAWMFVAFVIGLLILGLKWVIYNILGWF